MPQTKFNVDKLLQSVMNEMIEGFQVISPEFKYLYVNETVAKQGKRKKDELLGKTMMQCYPGIEKTQVFANIKKCLKEKKRIQLDNKFVYPDKSEAWFHLFIQPCKEGVVILSVDITKRKELEAKLFDKIKELNNITDAVIDREIKMIKLKDTISKLKEVVVRFDTAVVQ